MLLNLIVPALLVGTLVASGQDADPTLASAEQELAQIIAVLEAERAPSQRWWWGWLGGYTGLTLGQGIIAGVTRDPDTRIANVLGAAGSALGMANMAINVFPGWRGTVKLRAMPTETPEQRLEALRAGRALFERNARNEAAQFGFVAHAGGFVVSAATAGVLWFHYDLRVDAVVNLVGGVLITEAQAFTAPRGVHRAWRGRGVPTIASLRVFTTVEPRGVVVVADF